jgi:hypothetical protein
MSKGEHWRNALIWAAVCFVFMGLFMFGVVTLFRRGGVGEVLKSGEQIVIVVGSLIFSTALVGFAKRKSPISLRSLRNYLIWNVLAMATFALIWWGYVAFDGKLSLSKLGVSARIALFLGLALIFLASQGFLMFAAAHTRGRLLTEAQTETLRDQGRASIYSWIVVVAQGLTLILLSLAGPGRVLSPGIALAGVLVLLTLRIALSFAVWRLLDELSRTLARETGHAAFYMVFFIGGGWEILAHLGFVRAPAPLDWLTILIVITFVASFIAAGRCGLLEER